MFLKVQLQTMKSTLAVTHPVRATIEAGKSIVRELGWRGFYRCLPSQVMCEATGRGFHFGNYELIKSFFGLSVYTVRPSELCALLVLMMCERPV